MVFVFFFVFFFLGGGGGGVGGGGRRCPNTSLVDHINRNRPDWNLVAESH